MTHFVVTLCKYNSCVFVVAVCTPHKFIGGYKVDTYSFTKHVFNYSLESGIMYDFIIL